MRPHAEVAFFVEMFVGRLCGILCGDVCGVALWDSLWDVAVDGRLVELCELRRWRMAAAGVMLTKITD